MHIPSGCSRLRIIKIKERQRKHEDDRIIVFQRNTYDNGILAYREAGTVFRTPFEERIFWHHDRYLHTGLSRSLCTENLLFKTGKQIFSVFFRNFTKKVRGEYLPGTEEKI